MARGTVAENVRVRRVSENEFEVLAEAEIEHLVGLVQHNCAQGRHVERMAFDMVAQAPRRADHDMCAAFQCPAFGPHVHAAHAGGDGGAGRLVKPVEFALHLKRQFARRRNGERQRRARAGEVVLAGQQGGRQRQAEGHGLAGAGLGGDERIGIGHFGRQHGLLHGGERFIAALFQSGGERGINPLEFGHIGSFGTGRPSYAARASGGRGARIGPRRRS
jgi:hypothetical protein